MILDPATYVAHPLHRDDRAWPETNCYVDLWIELMHALGVEPVAAMAFTVALDWEGDQWTFFKFPLEDLYELYGVDTLELQLWTPLPEAIATQLARRRHVIVEMDAFYLPDTHGVSYGLDHVKTSVAVWSIDLAAKRLGYFHNRGAYLLEGADYAAAFQPALMPPYTEVVKLTHLRKPPVDELRRLARGQLRRHLGRRPAQNPLRAFAADFARDLSWLREQPLAAFHKYSFATVRQLGANFECAATFLRWLGGEHEAGAAAAFDQIATTAKAMQFRLARVANAKKPYDATESLESLAAAWELGMSQLAVRVG